MTPSHAELLAECERLRARVAQLEARVAELDPPRPRLTCESLGYPKRADEV